ncbi:unnamed protein product [Tenebrio molitor]|nr:unnamed protein product [Tenebrio molitor]
MMMFWCVLFVWVAAVQGGTETTEVTTSTAAATAPEGTQSTTPVAVVTTTVKPARSEDPPVQVLDELTGLAHNVSSGKIMVIGNNTFHISNFYFDGQAPNVHFLVGRGDKVSQNGTFVPLDSSDTPLKAYSGEDVTVVLPGGLTVSDIDWLAVWCITHHQNLGYVRTKTDLYPPQTFGLNNEVTSGPVVLVDKKTLFVPNFRYSGDRGEVHFWVGNGSDPTPEGVAIPDETGSLQSLHAYQGESIYLELPNDVSTDSIDYFGVWSADEQVSMGSVPIKGIKGVPEHAKFKARTLLSGVNDTLRLPKCCPIDSILKGDGCTKTSSPYFRPNIKVFEHNETHFNNESLDLALIKFEPYVSSPVCQSGKYPLNESNEEFAILANGSLLVKGSGIAALLSQDQYCLEYIDAEESTSILICAPEYQIQTAMFVTYVIFTIISTLCFAATFFVYFFWLKIEDVHRKCFTGYVLAMFMTFLSLTIVQTANVEDKGCEVLGFLFQISMIASFTLLGILCFDILIIITYIDEDTQKRRRKYWYLGIAIAVPVLSLIISLARNLTPDVPNSFFKPQYGRNTCYFDAEEQRTVLFNVPIGIPMVVSAVCLILTKLRIVKNDRECENNYYWLEKGQLFKFMWRKHFIIFLTSLMWLAEALISLNYASSSMLIAMDVVEASLGVFILMLFVVNKQTRKRIVKRMKMLRRAREKKNQNIFFREDELMMTPVDSP